MRIVQGKNGVSLVRANDRVRRARALMFGAKLVRESVVHVATLRTERKHAKVAQREGTEFRDAHMIRRR